MNASITLLSRFEPQNLSHKEAQKALPITEQENPRSQHLSSQSSRDIVELMNAEDATVAAAVHLVLDDVAKAVDETVARLRAGGKLYYVGTGTSGRLGVLDASECPPTFGVSPELVQGVIAGGYDACYRAVEASEDDANAGGNDLQQRGLTGKDVVVGIAASGKTPYTVGAVTYARSLGAFTVGLTCVPDSPITNAAELSIVPVVGPEVLTGSSRLKAGTAQKMVLNMISTATMVGLGYVSGNRMSNLQARNVKLRDRAVRIVMAETGRDFADALEALEATGWKVPDAVQRIRSPATDRHG
ncbi:MAG TPA: N-acetylmuramic acid 6-phosphate etherase [Pyrinomonadaceae bacterium]|nr:N-acetylmuramic acid 6-phosphate etherase [Pyrinomonadaceae bacterium]